MAKDNTTEYVVRIVVRTIQLSKNDILELLRRSGISIPGHARIDKCITNDANFPMASVHFKVPSGGDHSGMTIPVDDESPITVILQHEHRESRVVEPITRVR